MGKKTRHYTEDEFVLCPYYLREDPIQVKCVGICGTHTINVFGSSKEKEDFKFWRIFSVFFEKFSNFTLHKY